MSIDFFNDFPECVNIDVCADMLTRQAQLITDPVLFMTN